MAKKTVNVEDGTVTFDFGEAGQTVINYDELPADIQRQLGLHGLSQKGGDSYAGAKSACAESDMDPEVWSKGQVDSVAQQLAEGNWAVRAGGGGPAITDLARALAEATGSDLEDAVERLADADKDTKNALRKHPDIASVLARIRRERAEAKEKELAGKAGSGPDIGEILGG